jgi:hypothetical protein
MNSERQSTTEEEMYRTRLGWMKEFLWSCAGVNKGLLRQCPTDYAKYENIGGAVLLTSFMAMLSGGYAISTIFINQNPFVWVVLGVFWGLIIFNLDRLMVSSINADWSVKMKIVSISPRIIMAIFLGFIISTPLELRIYDDEIGIQIEKDKDVERKSYMADDQHRLDSLQQKKIEIESAPLGSETVNISINKSNENLIKTLNELQAKANEYSHDISVCNTKIALYNRLNNQEDKKGKYINQIIIERNKKAGKQRLLNPVTQKIKEINAELMANDGDYRRHVESDLEQRKKDIAAIDEDIEKIKMIIDNKRNDKLEETLCKKYGGFQARMKAFGNMKESESSTQKSALFISLFFVIIECVPTVFKVLISEGSYDDMLRADKLRLYAKSQEIISKANDEVNVVLSIAIQENRDKKDAQIRANKVLMEKMSDTQAELLQVAIDKWKEEELKKIEENPVSYIHSNTKM